jgi:hypothetical protein
MVSQFDLVDLDSWGPSNFGKYPIPISMQDVGPSGKPYTITSDEIVTEVYKELQSVNTRLTDNGLPKMNSAQERAKLRELLSAVLMNKIDQVTARW